MKIEVHVHTRYSKDSFLPLTLLYLKCIACGIKWIAITEHNNIDGGVAFKKYCQKHGNKVRVIVGEEIFTSEGEIIGLYLTKQVPAGMSSEETISLIKKQNGVVYIPHPYDEKRSKTVLKESALKRNKNQIDCIEVHNGRNISEQYDDRQKSIADRYNLRPIIGSDAHTLIEIGRNYIECDEVDLTKSEVFISQISSFRFHKMKCIRLAHVLTKFAKTITILMKGNFHELYRIINRKVKRSKY